MRYIRKRHRDPQRAVLVEQCACCGGELYPGNPCWRLAGRTLCEDCVVPWLLRELAPFRGRAGEVEP